MKIQKEPIKKMKFCTDKSEKIRDWCMTPSKIMRLNIFKIYRREININKKFLR